MSLSKNYLKLITSLHQKKYRVKHKLFIAEGVKVVNEFLKSSFVLEKVFIAKGFSLDISTDRIIEVSDFELKKISQLKTPNKVVGLFQIPEEIEPKRDGLILVLDTINDPGNLGTIIRLCDWFGIEQLVCSIDTVDCYNAKVVQSSMGSLKRVQINYVDLVSYLTETNLPTFIADMNGENVYNSQLPKEAILVLGNEANGVSFEVKKIVENVVAIPRFGDTKETESLNVATATAILLSEFRR